MCVCGVLLVVVVVVCVGVVVVVSLRDDCSTHMSVLSSRLIGGEQMQ